MLIINIIIYNFYGNIFNEIIVCIYNTNFIQFSLIKYMLNMCGKYNLELNFIINNKIFSKTNVDCK
jgi:hypothetical protein